MGFSSVPESNVLLLQFCRRIPLNILDSGNIVLLLNTFLSGDVKVQLLFCNCVDIDCSRISSLGSVQASFGIAPIVVLDLGAFQETFW